MMQHMGPMMMPYCPQTPVPMMMDKGFGKGMNYPAQVPMPPLPPPSAPLPGTMAPVAPPTWVPNMQMMPIPIPPAMPASSTEDLEQKAEATAQKKLNKLLAAMKKEEDALSPQLQNMAHTMQKKDDRDHTKNAVTAVKALGDAKEALLEAESARAQLVSQWKTFLQQSMVKWQEFTAQFQASETAHQARIQAAKLEVSRAQRRFDQASKTVKSGEDAQVISDEEDSDVMDVKDEELIPDESATKIHEGMFSIVKSLEALSESADQLEQRVKRPRRSVEEDMTGKPDFGKADVS